LIYLVIYDKLALCDILYSLLSLKVEGQRPKGGTKHEQV